MRGLSLLHSQAEERPLLLPHQAQPRLRPRVIKLPAAELRHLPLAAVDAHRPEVVVALVPLPRGDGHHTIRIRVLEPQRFAELQPRVGGEVGAPRVQDGEAGLGGGVDAGVDVEVGDAVVGRHIALVAIRSPSRSQHRAAENRDRHKRHPRRVLEAALPLIPPRRGPRGPEQAHCRRQPHQHHRVGRRGHLEPHGEPHADEHHHEDHPG
mmetsp:Transcript_7958/g.18778  ORF Transcript_7958/g.18778 Transcript_7958/m.18778 type:complete len:209 (-) Transcript_7958:146-772(-)